MAGRRRAVFSLFPFVSILLAVVGTLTFLTIAIAVMSPSVDSKSSNADTLIYEKRSKDSKTWFVEFKNNNISIMEMDEKINEKRHYECTGDTYRKKLDSKGGRAVALFLQEIAVKNRTRGGESFKYDQFLFLVHPSGVPNYKYIEFIVEKNIGGKFAGNTRTALVLLDEDEEYSYDQ